LKVIKAIIIIKSKAPNRNMGYPQVLGSIPAENSSMDLT